jgi:hypothetical protein
MAQDVQKDMVMAAESKTWPKSGEATVRRCDEMGRELQ